MATFVVAISEPHIALVILANIEVAIQEDCGHKFLPSMQNVRRAYKYDAIHDAASIKYIMTEMAGSDGVYNLRDAPYTTP